MRHYLTFGGRPTTEFNVYISGAGTFGAPERDRKTVTIPGRDGELTLDNGRYKNIKVTYPAFIAKDYSMSVEALRNYLLSVPGYERLEDTYHPGEFRKGRYSGSFEGGSTKGMRAGSFKIEFDCMPQRWLKEGEKQITLSASGRIINPTMMEAKPLLYVVGTGTLVINDIEMVIGASPMYIDCELQEAYNAQGGSMNSDLTLSDGVFPTLLPGVNLITPTTSITITPRWWIL
jgi:phage-related protein